MILRGLKMTLGNILARPTATLGAVSGTDVPVNWAAITNATNYIVETDDDSSFASPTQIYSGSALTTTITGLSSTPIYVRVKAQGSGYNDSNWSNSLTATTQSGDPNLLSGFTYRDVLTKANFGTPPINAVNHVFTFPATGYPEAATGLHMNQVGSEIVMRLSQTPGSPITIIYNWSPNVDTGGRDDTITLTDTGRIEYFNADTQQNIDAGVYNTSDYIGVAVAASNIMEIVKYSGGVRTVIGTRPYGGAPSKYIKITSDTSAEIKFLQYKNCTVQ